MKTSSNMLFMLMMITSTISVMNTSTWLTMWICLEINMMSFIPMIYNYKNMFSSQSTMVYFLTQSMSSMIFISFILLNNLIFSDLNMLESMIIILMMIKMGMPPMHMWFIQIMKKMSWPMCFLILTWQKMAPMYIVSTVIHLNSMTMSMILLSTILGAILGLNQTSVHKIMAFSSINHLGWMMGCASCQKKSWLMYLTLYTFLMLTLCVILYNYNVMYINQMNMFSKNLDKITMITLMMSLGGIPPFLGFLPKWMAINYMIYSNEMFLLLIMTTSSLITLIYYLRMISSMNLMSTHSQKWMLLSNYPSNMYMLIINMLLPMMIMFINFN